jgi:hypothetical protein
MVATPASVVRLGILALILWLGQSQTVFAGPFQGGTISWERDATFVSATEVRFNVRIELTLERNGTFGAPVVGQQLTNGQFRFTLYSNSAPFQTVSFWLMVTSVNETEGWFVASRVVPVTVARSRLPVRVFMNECCRSDVLRDNNQNQYLRLETFLPAPTAPADTIVPSPRSLMPPRWYWLQNATALVQLTAANPDGVTNGYAIANGTQSALFQIRPGATLNLQAGGVVYWQPLRAGLHAVQFRLLALDAAGMTQASIPYDVIIDVVPECRAYVIGCNTAPAFIPEEPGTFTARVNELLRIPITATDFDYGDTVTVLHSPLSEGMTVRFDSSTRNTSRYLLEWTPARPDLLRDPAVTGPVYRRVCLQAQDSRGAASDGNHCLIITVDESSGTPPALTCPAPQTMRGGSAGVVNVTLQATLEGAAGRTMNASWITPAGETTSTVSGLDLHTWSVSGELGVGTHVFEARSEFSTGTVSCSTSVTVTPRAAQQITGEPINPVTLGSGDVTLVAVASSGLPVSFALVSGPGVLSGNVLTPTNSGTIQLIAFQGGDEDFLPAPSVPFSVLVNPKPRSAQQISVTPVNPLTFGDAPVALVAASSSGLAVAFEVVSGPGSLAGNVLTPLGSGTIQLLASQAGDESWLPAEPVAFSVIVNPAPPPPPPPPPPPTGPQYALCLVTVGQFGESGPLSVRLQVCDAAGVNVSAATLRVTVAGLVDDDGCKTPVRGIGHTSGDTEFAFDSETRSYVFNMKNDLGAHGDSTLVLRIGSVQQPASVTISPAVMGATTTARRKRAPR